MLLLTFPVAYSIRFDKLLKIFYVWKICIILIEKSSCYTHLCAYNKDIKNS